jgi:hypothetical protein
MKSVRWFFLIGLLAYCLWPRDDELRVVGIGEAGARLLLYDVFVLVLLFGCLSVYKRSFQACRQTFGWLPISLFGAAVAFSLARGLPPYGGMAIGEARWYFLVLLIPVGYAICEENVFRSFKKVILVAATWHAIWVLVATIFSEVEPSSGGLIRAAGGPQADQTHTLADDFHACFLFGRSPYCPDKVSIPFPASCCNCSLHGNGKAQKGCYPQNSDSRGDRDRSSLAAGFVRAAC